MHIIGTEAEYSTHYVPAPGEESRSYAVIANVCKAYTDRLLRVENLPEGVQSSAAIERNNRSSAIGRNNFLTTGARWYPEHAAQALPELATQETTNAYDATVVQTRGRRFVREVNKNTLEDIAEDQRDRLFLFFRTIDAEGSTMGHHTNYSTRVDLQPNVGDMAPMLVSRLGDFMLFGAGCINRRGQFAVSQKNETLNHLMHTSTTSPDKPIISRRDEPHGDRLRRLHLVNSDAKHSPWAVMLELGWGEILVEFMEKCRFDVANRMMGFLPAYDIFHDEMRQISHNPEGNHTITTRDFGELTAINLMEVVFDQVKAAIERGDISVKGKHWIRQVIVDEMEWAIEMTRTNPGALQDLVDWRYRNKLLDILRDRGATDAKLKHADIMFDDVMETRYSRAFQNPLEAAGVARMAKILGKHPIEIKADFDNYKAVIPGNRAETRARLIGQIAGTDVFRAVNWDYAFIGTNAYRMSDPFSTKVRIRGAEPEELRDLQLREEADERQRDQDQD